MKNTIVIVDDHIMIAQALRGIIANFDSFEVVYECANGKDLIDAFAVGKPKPKLVLLDISMPVMDGFETAKWLNANHPEILILTLSMQDDEQSVIKMIKNGANGYLLKNAHPTELEKALSKLIEEGYYYPDWASRLVFASLHSDKANQNTIKLTDREKEFLTYCVTEMSYKEIAEKMFCSPRTVESYRDSLFEKLELKTRVGLAVFAIKNKFAE